MGRGGKGKMSEGRRGKRKGREEPALRIKKLFSEST